MNIKNQLYISVFLELSAIASITAGRDFGFVILFFILHFAASFIITHIIITTSSLKSKKKILIHILLTALNTATFIAGYIISVYLLRRYLKKFKEYVYLDLERINPNIIFDFPLTKRNIGEGAAYLYISSAPKNIKENIINKFSFENTNQGIEIINRLKNDPDYEIRLYAFQRINFLKKKIVESINNALSDFKKNEKDFYTIKRLIFLYWDFYNLGLADEGLSGFYIEKILYYIGLSEKIAGDGEIIFIKANIMKIKKDYETSLELFEKSLHYGMNTHTVYPLMAEVYYIIGDFKRVREILISDPTLKLDFNTYAITETWEVA